MTDSGYKLRHTSEALLNGYNEMETQCLDKVKGGKLKSHNALVLLLDAYIKTSEMVRSLANELLCSPDEDDKDLAADILVCIQDVKERGELLIEYLEEHDPRRG